MKYNLLFLAVICIVGLAWIKINHEKFPPPPKSYTEMSKTVNLKFKIGAKDLNSVELSLNRGQGPNNFYVLFDMSDKWASGNFGMILRDMSETSKLKSSSGKSGDFSRFEKDNSGKKVDVYSFDQTIVQGDDNVTYMQFKYTGAAMPLIQSLKVENKITLPRNISARFENKQDIVLLPGNYGIDPNISGFWIPIEIN